MAQGDCYLFRQFKRDVLTEVHNMGADTIKCALVTSSYTPTVNDTYPCWGNSPTSPGGVDASANEVSAGGNYTAGGATCANPTVTIGGSPETIQVDFDDPTTSPVSVSSPTATWDYDAANPTNARWAIIYNNSAANKECIGYVDLGADYDLSGGSLTIRWNAPFATVS